MRFLDEIKEAEIFSSLASIFGWNVKGWLTLHLAAAFVGVLFDSVLRFIDVHILSPHQLYLLISAMVAIDFAAGLWLAKKRGVVRTDRLMRGVWKWLAYTLMIFLATNLSKYGGNIVFTWVPTAVVTPMALTLLLSIGKNLKLLGLIPATLFDAILNQVDKYKEGIAPGPDNAPPDATNPNAEPPEQIL